MIEETMEKRARNRLLFMGVLLAFSSIFQMGYANAYPNTAIDSFRKFLNTSLSEHHGPLSDSGFTWIWSGILNIYFVGFAIGSWLAVPIADRIGRKWCLVAGNGGNFVSACLATVSIVFLWPIVFFVSRLLFAISAAVSMNSLILLLQESSPPSMRGIMSFNAEMAFVVMNLVGALAGMRAVLGEHIDWLVGLSCIPTLFSLIVALRFHESPKYLALKKRDKEAAEEALYFYQRTDANQSAAALLLIESERTSDDEQSVSIIHSPHTLFGLMLGICTLQLTSSIWAILFFSTEFLTRTNISAEDAELVSTIMLFISSLSTVIGMVIVEKYARRLILLSSATVNVGALLLFVICELAHHYYDPAKYGCIAAVVLHGISYSIGLGPIAWFLTAELVPLSHRALCQSLALSVNQLVTLVIVFVTLPLYNTIGSLVILLLFVLPGAACIAFLVVYLPETRGMTMDEVIRQMPSKFLCCTLPSNTTTSDDTELSSEQVEKSL